MRWCACVLLLIVGTSLRADDGNRFAYLDAYCDPYYVHREFAKLTTPQWVGEDQVEAVVVLAIDDMRDPARYETYLRPILDRLKQIDGRAPVSIMTCSVDPQDELLAKWLKEGLSIECHTVDHPCPLLQGGDFDKAKSTYERCVDLMCQIPGNTPVAFRMPCCDSRNTPSPRFWTEIFNQRTDAGNFLSLDSSVFCVLTPKDASLPRELVFDANGAERFRKYIPFPSFVNTIEDYPYPYLIGDHCWEFPCIVPSDWEAQNLQQPNNPKTVADLKTALDGVVVKQGVFNLVFHPHGWIRNDQVVELIDHAEKKHAGKVKFLTFREALQRIESHLLGEPLRNSLGESNKPRLLDVNGDGFIDVISRFQGNRQLRLWSPKEKRWQTCDLPNSLASPSHPLDVCFGILEGKHAIMLHLSSKCEGWRFEDGAWVSDSRLVQEGANSDLLRQLPAQPSSVCRLRDIDRNGSCELIYTNPASRESHVYAWDAEQRHWRKLPFGLPQETALVDTHGQDAGLRFLDIDKDGDDDVLYSNETHNSLHRFHSLETGWSNVVFSAARQVDARIPMIVRQGSNNGAWFHSEHLWVQNEDTSRLPDGVDRRSFQELLETSSEPPSSD
jgi:hypothetical protein